MIPFDPCLRAVEDKKSQLAAEIESKVCWIIIFVVVVILYCHDGPWAIRHIEL